MDCNDKIKALIREVNSLLSEYSGNHMNLSWREKVLLLVDAGIALKTLGKHTDIEASKVGARDRIRLYLQHHIGTIVTAKELEVVASISEYARRIRELRVQDGYKILTGYSNDPEMGLELGPTDYILLDPEPDTTAARRWHVANRIRRDKTLGSQAKVLSYFLENIGEIITTEELAYVSNNARQYARRTRELRTEEGYAISTRFTGRPDLKMGEYILESSDRISAPHDRKISFEVQKLVYERDENRCRMCSWDRSKWTRDDSRILELHHIEHHASGGHNISENLVVLCSRCHDSVHSGNLELPENIVP